MGNNGKKAWLVTDELESGKGPVTVMAVLSPQTGFATVETTVDILWRALHISGDEKLQWMGTKNPPPYRPDWTNSICYCGQGRVIVARKVTGLREAPFGQGIDGLLWDDMPEREKPAGN
jgi:hypothetical protein